MYSSRNASHLLASIKERLAFISISGKWFLLVFLAICGNANAYLIKDFGFTNLVNGGLEAKVNSKLYFDSNYAPGKYDYRYQVSNIGNVVIDEFGVFGGNLATINTTLCTIAPNAAACAGAGALPNWIANLTRPDLAWKIDIKSDGLAVPASYGVSWSKAGGLAVGQTLTFQVASTNPPIIGGAFVDPDATSSGFFIQSSDGSLAQATYASIPEPSSILLIIAALFALQFMRLIRKVHAKKRFPVMTSQAL